MEKYNNSIMEAVRYMLGYEYDESHDEEIMKLSKNEVFNAYCLYNGINYNEMVSVLTEVFGIEV